MSLPGCIVHEREGPGGPARRWISCDGSRPRYRCKQFQEEALHRETGRLILGAELGIEAMREHGFHPALRVVGTGEHPFEQVKSRSGRRIEFDEQPPHVAEMKAIPMPLSRRRNLEGRWAAVDDVAVDVFCECAVEDKAERRPCVIVPWQGASGGVHALGERHPANTDLARDLRGRGVRRTQGHDSVP